MLANVRVPPGVPTMWSLAPTLLVAPPTLAQEAVSTVAEPPIPVPNIDRPTTLPRWAARLDPAVELLGPDAGRKNLYLGAAFGVLDTIELGFQLPVAELARDSASFTTPSVYGLTAVDATSWLTLIGLARLTLIADPDDVTTLDLEPTVQVRLSTAIEITFAPVWSVALSPRTGHGLAVPVVALAQVTDRAFLEATTGFGFENVDARQRTAQATDGAFSDELAWTVGASAGYTLGRSGGPLADVHVLWFWPALLERRDGRTRWGVDQWSLMLLGSVYFPPSRR